MKLWISYPWGEEPKAAVFKEMIRARGEEVYSFPDVAPTGESALGKVTGHIERCDAFVYVATTTLENDLSGFVEVGTAIARNRKTGLPVLVPIRLTPDAPLPAVLETVRSYAFQSWPPTDDELSTMLTVVRMAVRRQQGRQRQLDRLERLKKRRVKESGGDDPRLLIEVHRLRRELEAISRRSRQTEVALARQLYPLGAGMMVAAAAASTGLLVRGAGDVLTLGIATALASTAAGFLVAFTILRGRR